MTSLPESLMSEAMELEPNFDYLKKLWVLRTIVESGSLSGAAKKHQVTVSAISQKVSSLESDLGRKLFSRKDRRLIPTEFCLNLIKSAEPVFALCGDLPRDFQEAPALPKMKWLSFGVGESFAISVVPPFYRQLRQKMPKLKLTLRVGQCQHLTELVKQGELCMALVSENDAMAGVTVYPLYEEELGLYIAQNMGPKTPRLSVRDLGYASYRHGKSTPTYYSRFLRAIDPGLRPALVSDNHDSLLALAETGSMYVVLPKRIALRASTQLTECLKILKPNSELGKFKVCLVSQKTCDPAEDEFLLRELKTIC